MTQLQIVKTIWESKSARFSFLKHSRISVVALWSRMSIVLAVVGMLVATTLVSTLKAEQSTSAMAMPGGAPKDAVRIAASSPVPAMPFPHVPEVDPLSAGSLFAGRPTAQPVRFGSSTEPIAVIGRFKPWMAPVPAEWREQEFEQVGVLDGRTLQAGSFRIRLIGLDLPLGEQVCRTLDGRFELCAARAATQLELLTRHRRVTCHYRADLPRETIGRCRIGTSDLSERMVQTGYVWRSAAVMP